MPKVKIRASIIVEYEVERTSEDLLDILEREEETLEGQLPKIDHAIFSGFEHRLSSDVRIKLKCLRPSQHEEENE